MGSFGDTYDLELIIGGARQLQAQGINDCQFVLSGDGERGAHLKKLAEGLNNVVFTGWLNESQIAGMMKMAHIGLAAYRQGAPQGLPNKIFEYMAAGLPILSSLTGECEQFLGANRCGVSYSAGSSESFIAAFSALTASKGLARIRKERLAHVSRELFVVHCLSTDWPHISRGGVLCGNHQQVNATVSTPIHDGQARGIEELTSPGTAAPCGLPGGGVSCRCMLAPRKADRQLRVLHLVFYWVHHLLRRRCREYCVYLVFHGKALVHYSVVRSRDYRFPFMDAGDIQVGPAWTHPDHRRRAWRARS